MMGWRVGYIAYQDQDGLGDQLLKVQDTIAVRPLPDPARTKIPGLGFCVSASASLKGNVCNVCYLFTYVVADTHIHSHVSKKVSQTACVSFAFIKVCSVDVTQKSTFGIYLVCTFITQQDGACAGRADLPAAAEPARRAGRHRRRAGVGGRAAGQHHWQQVPPPVLASLGAFPGAQRSAHAPCALRCWQRQVQSGRSGVGTMAAPEFNYLV